MTAHRINLPDWRDNLKGLPVAVITEHGIKRISKGKDKQAQEHVEEIDETELEGEIMEFVSEQNRRAG